MIKVPKGVSPAPGRGAQSQQQQHMKRLLPLLGSAGTVATSLASPQMMRTGPTAYFTQIYPQPAAPRGSCLYATPYGADPKALRSATLGRLPVSPAILIAMRRKKTQQSHLRGKQAKRKLDLEGTDQQCTPEFRTPKGKGRPASRVSSPKTPRSPGEKTRYDTSLGLLTKKFIHLLSESEDGVLDLNRAAEVLEVQKRRIYDITNVLEGIQLIRKKSKNNIQWMGTGIFHDSRAVSQQQALQDELVDLSKKERTLEELIQTCTQQLKDLTEDEDNQRLAYVTYQDIRSINNFKDQTVIAIKAPPETRLEVPDLNEETLQIYLKSTNGPIEVYLCPEEISEDSSNRSKVARGPHQGAVLQESCSPLSPQPKTEPVKTELASPLLDVEERILDLPHHLLQQTEDQLPSTSYEVGDTPFISFSPPLDQDDYLWGLDSGEGVSNLFDSYDLGDLLKN
ncbi:transcription factor E2F2-like isoform X1 [Rhinatrema bivittatum]|uniref:transcription factor E2F2-like isoform X1 n=1 Tax=Rhinatrema bivittatum TaxID=194408 RepID=UPI00112DDE9B|nr:transcription factor E2F2-like isoform X1 [Rhinatrema bivittatum]XP_029475752.1 transcription factor E2F2-like isoform X1 [Rhinatrema bivittatum]